MTSQEEVGSDSPGFRLVGGSAHQRLLRFEKKPKHLFSLFKEISSGGGLLLKPRLFPPDEETFPSRLVNLSEAAN